MGRVIHFPPARSFSPPGGQVDENGRERAARESSDDGALGRVPPPVAGADGRDVDPADQAGERETATDTDGRSAGHKRRRRGPLSAVV
jgi:hypothetical protein